MNKFVIRLNYLVVNSLEKLIYHCKHQTCVTSCIILVIFCLRLLRKNCFASDLNCSLLADVQLQQKKLSCVMYRGVFEELQSFLVTLFCEF